jgi:hypothetical protein
MKAEPIAFYPFELKAKKSIMIGTLHVKIIDGDLEFHIRGIRVFIKSKQLLFFMPRALGLDTETGKKIHFPIFCLDSVDKNKQLLQDVQHVGKKFISENFPECLPKIPSK